LNAYLEKRSLFPELINEKPPEDLFNVIVIPCYNEPDVLSTLESLNNCSAPQYPVEVIVVINGSSGDSEEIILQNERSQKSAINFSKLLVNRKMQVHVLVKNDLPIKHAGVGLARKLGMDEAVRRFEKNETSVNGIITCLDADCTVNKEYLVEIEQHFLANSKCPGISIKYEHDISGDGENTAEIVDYELHLRYYNQALLLAGLPYSYQTVGSAMSVRSMEYQKQGGMNRRKAGEDFYFLHKFTSLTHFGHLKNAIVYPSSRVSERVPFGTGRAMLKMKNDGEKFMTYQLSAFLDLKYLVEKVKMIYENISNLDELIEELPNSITSYLKEQGRFEKDWNQIRSNTNSLDSFRKRFFVWLDAFWVMKYLNYNRLANGGEDVGIAAKELYTLLDLESIEGLDNKKLLILYRTLSRE